MSTGVVYGTDVFCALVQRPALARVDDATLTAVMGNVHRFGDRRMPVPGILGIIAAAAASSSPHWPAGPSHQPPQEQRWHCCWSGCCSTSASARRSTAHSPPPPTTTRHRPTPAHCNATGTASSSPEPSCRAWPPPRCASASSADGHRPTTAATQSNTTGRRRPRRGQRHRRAYHPEDSAAVPIDVLANDTGIDAGPKTVTTTRQSRRRHRRHHQRRHRHQLHPQRRLHRHRHRCPDSWPSSSLGGAPAIRISLVSARYRLRACADQRPQLLQRPS